MNTQLLLWLANEGEKRGVEMHHWIAGSGIRKKTETRCGTVGCLVGTDLCCHPEALPEITAEGHVHEYIPELMERYGLTKNEFDWLFLNGPNYYSPASMRNLCETTTEQAVSRLRKFIYFKLKQKEIHDAWNERHHRRHDQAENTGHVLELVGT